MKKPLKIALLVLPIHGAVAALTWRDIDRRPATAIRGAKAMWKLWSGLNTLGSGAYWLVGRR